MRLILRIVIISICVLPVACATPPKAVNAEKYGPNAPQVWMPMTQTEVDILKEAESGLNGDVKFKLALLFTGDTREKEEVEAALNNYHYFEEKCDKELSSIGDIKEKGKKLHKLFFDEFIRKLHPDGHQSSGISGLILKQEYDGNTAIMLFSILAERYGFTPEIVLTEGDISKITSKKTHLSMNVITGRLYLTLRHPQMQEPVTILVT